MKQPRRGGLGGGMAAWRREERKLGEINIGMA